MKTVFNLLIISISSALLLISCAVVENIQHRTELASNCLFDLGSENDETKLLSSHNYQQNEKVRCSFQIHTVPNAEQWKNLDIDGRLNNSNKFNLSFVEMNETGNSLFDPNQLSTLVSSLQKNSQNYVVTFVHGWRHNAGIGNSNVKNFRTILGYTRSFLNHRCISRKLYCNTTLTGVYIGWRGRYFHEDDKKENDPLGTISALPSFWGRQKQSDKFGEEHTDSTNEKPYSLLGQVLKNIQSELHLEYANPHKDKFLIMGHSMGGNMLATVMQEKLKTTLGSDNKKQLVESPYGDLVVLLNAASEASKWTPLQLVIRKKANFDDDENIIHHSNATPEQKKKLSKWRNLFPKTQPPIYMALTAANNWHEIEAKDRKIISDFATKTVFPIGKLVGGSFKREERLAIGHLTPKYTSVRTLKGRAVGPSHELILNEAAWQGHPTDKEYLFKTTFENSGRPESTRCASGDSWLYNARKKGVRWDQGTRKKGQIKNISGQVNGADMQFRNALYLKHFKNAYSVSQGNNPIWNVRVFDSAIKDHGGYVGYPLFCSINQIVLDNVTNK